MSKDWRKEMGEESLSVTDVREFLAWLNSLEGDEFSPTDQLRLIAESDDLHLWGMICQWRQAQM